MNSEDLKKRFKKFAIDVALLITELPKNAVNIPYSNQIIRSSSSPGPITGLLAGLNQQQIL
jgi:hypothetical protein